MDLSDTAEDFLRMYKGLTDPELLDERRRKTEREARKKERMSDTGL